MYLSKISLADPQAWFRRRRKIRSDLFREHQMIWELFDNSPAQKRDFLYRREDRQGELPFYYVLSRRQPRYAGMDLIIQSKEFSPFLKTEDRLQFSLRANAVITRKVDHHSNKRIRRDVIEAKVDEYKKQFPRPEDRPAPYIIHQEAAEEWLKRQGDVHGFTVDEFFVENHVFHKVQKPGDPNIRRFASLDIHGRLTVADPKKTGEVLRNGLGRSKAFGCGLLLVRRI